MEKRPWWLSLLKGLLQMKLYGKKIMDHNKVTGT